MSNDTMETMETMETIDTIDTSTIAYHNDSSTTHAPFVSAKCEPPPEKVVCLMPVTGPDEIYGYIGIVIIVLLALYALMITIWFCWSKKKLSRGKSDSTTARASELKRLTISRDSDSKKGSDSKKSSRTDKEENKLKKKKADKVKVRVSQSRAVRTETVDDVRSTWGPVQPEVMTGGDGTPTPQ